MPSRLMLVVALSLYATVAAAQVPPGSSALPPLAPAGDTDTPDQDENAVGDAPKPAESAVTPPAGSPPGTAEKAGDISLEDWSRDDWMLIKPKVSLVDLDGYLRIRGDMFRRLDFDNGAVWEKNSSDTVPRYRPFDDGHANHTGTNMRLRIEPRINITEQLQIVTTFDVFDNLLLGSTPDSLRYGMQTTPLNILSESQRPPRRGENSLTDSIVVKRVYGRVTALNEQLELRFGRMPDHWGLGMMTNSGDCLDCDYGTVVDRFAITFRALDHIFMPMVDWVSRGPTHRPFGPNDPQPLDAVSWDDTMQYGLRIMREDHPDDIKDALNHGKAVLNYGMSNTFRLQARDVALRYYTSTDTATNRTGFDPARGLPETGLDERRDAFLYTGDLFGRYFIGNLELGAEAAVQAGSFRDRLIDPSSTDLTTTKLMKIGGAVEAKYHLRGDYRGVLLSLKAGGASGDSRVGMGALDQADTQRGKTPSGKDDALRNFQFSPDYHIDLLMFRRLIGTVTDALYLRPELAYRFDERVLGRLTGIYSQTMFSESSPSALMKSGSGSKPLGIEFDGELAYGMDTSLERGQFLASLAGGILFPLSGFNNANKSADKAGGDFAWTVQARMYLTF